jgi:hypothetical protein
VGGHGRPESQSAVLRSPDLVPIDSPPRGRFVAEERSAGADKNTRGYRFEKNRRRAPGACPAPGQPPDSYAPSGDGSPPGVHVRSHRSTCDGSTGRILGWADIMGQPSSPQVSERADPGAPVCADVRDTRGFGHSAGPPGGLWSERTRVLGRAKETDGACHRVAGLINLRPALASWRWHYPCSVLRHADTVANRRRAIWPSTWTGVEPNDAITVGSPPRRHAVRRRRSQGPDPCREKPRLWPRRTPAAVLLVDRGSENVLQPGARWKRRSQATDLRGRLRARLGGRGIFPPLARRIV